MTDSIKRLKELVDSSDNIVFFGGAGVSTESGIPDFRSTGGLYHQEWKYPPEVILSHTFYESNPEEFFRFYRAKLLAPDAKPNAAHKKLAQLEAAVRPAWSMMSAGTILNRNSSKKLINTTKMDESFALVQMPSHSVTYSASAISLPFTRKQSTGTLCSLRAIRRTLRRLRSAACKSSLLPIGRLLHKPASPERVH